MEWFRIAQRPSTDNVFVVIVKGECVSRNMKFKFDPNFDLKCENRASEQEEDATTPERKVSESAVRSDLGSRSRPHHRFNIHVTSLQQSSTSSHVSLWHYNSRLRFHIGIDTINWKTKLKAVNKWNFSMNHRRPRARSPWWLSQALYISHGAVAL